MIGMGLELYLYTDSHGETDVVVAESAIIHVEIRIVVAFACIKFKTGLHEDAQVLCEHVLQAKTEDQAPVVESIIFVPIGIEYSASKPFGGVEYVGAGQSVKAVGNADTAHEVIVGIIAEPMQVSG